MENTERNNVTAAERVRRSRKLKEKRDSATDKGVTLVEGALVAMMNKSFTVYVWDEETKEFLPKYCGVLDIDVPKN